MIIKCKQNLELSQLENAKCSWLSSKSNVLFNVYGIYVEDGSISYCIKSDEEFPNPVLVESVFFDVVSDSLFSGWVINVLGQNSHNIICKEWTLFENHLHFFTDDSYFAEDDNYFEMLENLDSFDKWVDIIDKEIKENIQVNLWQSE